MGRMAKAGTSDSGRAGTKNIGKTRTKRRKRKDLEELHRNVLEAKRNLRQRTTQNKKRKTTLQKVLNNFADKRQETEDICQDVAEKKDKKKKSKTICNRLLPETVFGIYLNGSKGHEVRRENRKLNQVNEARLKGDILKLLNGDETNPKFPWNGDEKLAENGKGSKALSSDESDYAGTIGGRVNRAKTPILGKSKRVKRINGEKKKINSIEEDELPAEKNEQQQFLQRENNCKRRLFEPNEDQTDSNRRGDATDSSDFVMGEIRFSPPPGNTRDVSPPEDCFRKKKHVERKEIETRKKTEKKLMPAEAKIGANFWGLSSTIYYERLCAMVCAENFENNRSEQPSGSDPLVKIRSTLRKFYRNVRGDRRRGREIGIAKGNKRREHTLSKVGAPLKDSSLPSTGEVQACITDSEMDQESSESGVTKVGSWRPKHFGRISNPKNSSVVPKTNEIFESNIQNEEIQLSENISASNNEQNNHCAETSNSIEKTIHSVTSFLENLGANPLKRKANIFEKAAHIAGQGQHSSDDSTEKPPRDFTFDMNQQNLVRRNTKHVPTILRRSNSRCGVLEDVYEKHQPLPPNNWPVNGPKRSTRTFAALPRRSQEKSNDSDYLQTPSIVNQLTVIDQTKANIFKTKLNFMKAKYRPDIRPLSSECQGLENSPKKHVKNVAKNRKDYVSQFFANGETAHHREWYPTDFAVHSQDPTSENRREEDKKSLRVNFGTRDDSKEMRRPQFEKGFPEDIPNVHPSNRLENPRYHMQTKVSFEFPCPEIPKNFEARSRRIFANEMVNVPSQRLLRENSEETFIRPRYLGEDSKTSTTGSRVSSLVSASRCGNEIQFVPEAFVEHIPIPSETKDEIKNRSFKPLPSYHANTLSVDRLAMNEAAGCAQRCRGVELRQRIRKPVMVFRPIQETRQQQEICDSRYRLTENGEVTINDAVRNFRVLTFDDNINQSASQHQAPEIYNLRYHSQPQQQQQQKSLSQPHCHQQSIHKRHSKHFDNQPTKYLAFDESDGRNPRRLPIFVNPNDNQAANGPGVSYNHEVEPTSFNAFAAPENTEIMCLNCHDGKNPRLHATRVQCYGQQQQRPEMGPRRTSEVALMLPCSAPLCQQAPTNNPVTTAPPHGPTTIKDIPRVYSMPACETLVPFEMTYQLEPPLYSQSRYDNENLSKRVQLPDGRVGIFVTENRSIDNSECLDTNAGASSRFQRIDMGNLNERNRSILANERIYY